MSAAATRSSGVSAPRTATFTTCSSRPFARARSSASNANRSAISSPAYSAARSPSLVDDAVDRPFLEGEPGRHELDDVLAGDERHLRRNRERAHPLLQRPAGRDRVGGRPVVHGDRRALGLHPRALDLVGDRQDRGDHVGGNRPVRESVRSDQANPADVDEAFELIDRAPGDHRDHAVALDQPRQDGRRPGHQPGELRTLDDRAERAVDIEEDAGRCRRPDERVERCHHTRMLASIATVDRLASWIPSPRSR